MTEENTQKIELIAESAAQRVMISLMMEAIHILVASSETNSSVLVRQAIDLRLKQKRGEHLYSAPPELDSRLQAAANRKFQSTFDALSVQLLRQFGSSQEKT